MSAFLAALGVLLGYMGTIFFVCAVIAAGKGPDLGSGRFPARRLSLISLGLIVLGLSLLYPRLAQAQISVQPGESIRWCNTLGARSAGGVICYQNVPKGRIELSYVSRNHWENLWHSGEAPPRVAALCRETNYQQVIEVVFDQGKYWVRTISCDTGESGEWARSS